MKIRSCYVSNSSSSSYVIAYDPLFFGDLETYFKEGYFDEETAVYDLKENYPFEEDYINKGIEKAKKDGKRVLYFRLDDNCHSIMTLMKMINESNGGHKLEIIYGDEEYN